MYNKIKKTVEFIQNKITFKPDVAIVLGSGLGEFAEKITVEKTISYNEIPNFPVSTVSGHGGAFIFGYLDDVKVVCMKGRVHYYEGYDISDVVLPIRVMKLLGAKILFLSNAAGGINLSYKPGTLMMLEDHISGFVPNPLIGPNIDELGVRFPDMTNVYDYDLQNLIIKTAKQNNIPLEKGVYLQFSGPSYETPAEIKMMRNLGADAVGMSTVCEAIAAKHMQMKVCAISCITNMASGITGEKLNHEEVKEVANRVKKEFETLVYEAIKEMAKFI